MYMFFSFIYLGCQISFGEIIVLKIKINWKVYNKMLVFHDKSLILLWG